jgi:SAM-dependent methyltransferase
MNQSIYLNIFDILLFARGGNYLNKNLFIQKLRNYIKDLPKAELSGGQIAPGQTQYIELDPQKEMEYMSEHKYRLEYTAQAIPVSEKSLNVLDIGPTPFTIFVKHIFPHYEVFALDRTELLKERFRKAGITLVAADLDNGLMPFKDNFFDVVIFTEVLEHIFYPPSRILHEVDRILKPGGKLVLSVPNIAALGNRMKLLLGRSILENGDQQMNRDWVHGHAHLHEYTKREITNLCTSSGFRVTNCEMLSMNPTSLINGSAKFTFKRMLYYSILAFVPAFRFTIFLECYKDYVKS